MSDETNAAPEENLATIQPVVEKTEPRITIRPPQAAEGIERGPNAQVAGDSMTFFAGKVVEGAFPDFMDSQTTKQPVVWFCANPDCRPDPNKFPTRSLMFESDYPECPKCGNGPPCVHKRSLIHLLVPARGGLLTGDLGRRYMMACDSKRDFIATRTNGESASGDPNAVNCPGCLAHLKKHIMTILENGGLVAMKQPELAPGTKILDY